MKKGSIFIGLCVIAIFSMSGCRNNSGLAVSSIEKSSSEILPFGFTISEFEENLINFGTFSDISIINTETSGKNHTITVQTPDKQSTTIDLTFNDSNYVSGIVVDGNQKSSFVDVSDIVIKSTDMHLDPDKISDVLELKNISSSNSAFKTTTSNGILFIFTNIKLTIQRSSEQKSEYNYIKIHSNPKSEDESDKINSEIVTSSEPLPTSIEEYLVSKTVGLQKNSTEMVDKISEVAKSDAESISEEQIQTAISYIRDNYPQYYDGPEVMEATMYYGYLLSYAFDYSDSRSELGMDTYQAVKYVYRGVETVLDNATKENLNQIEKDLAEIQ